MRGQLRDMRLQSRLDNKSVERIEKREGSSVRNCSSVPPSLHLTSFPLATPRRCIYLRRTLGIRYNTTNRVGGHDRRNTKSSSAVLNGGADCQWSMTEGRIW